MKFTFVFDRTSMNWNDNMDFNGKFLEMRFRYFSKLLNKQRYLTVLEFTEELDIKATESEKKLQCIYGWDDLRGDQFYMFLEYHENSIIIEVDADLIFNYLPKFSLGFYISREKLML